MRERHGIVVIGAGFAGALLARVLRVLQRDVLLLERGTHPRFAIGESTTPLANLSLERLAARYGLDDCHALAAHGRWIPRFPQLRRGLKRGFTYYRHHPGEPFANRGLASERLLVAASPGDHVADTHWVRADVDHHFVRAAAAAGVEYRDRVELTEITFDEAGARLRGTRCGSPFDLLADFVIDASGPASVLARQLAIPSQLQHAKTNTGVVFSHFTGVRLFSEVVQGLLPPPYPEDWAAVHHLIDEGWMYSLRFDDGVTSAGFTLTPGAQAELGATEHCDPAVLWTRLLSRYPTIAELFGNATALFPIRFQRRIQHRLSRATGARWAMLPHTFAFTDPLFSTGIAWSLRAVERLAFAFERCANAIPAAADLERYAGLLAREADQIDVLVAGAYEAMAHFDLFAAHAMIYFSTVSFSEARQRILGSEADQHAWKGFLGVGDPHLDALPADAWSRLVAITGHARRTGSPEDRSAFAAWVRSAVAPRNIGGFLEPSRHNLYGVDLALLVDRHALLGMDRETVIASLPRLRGGGS